MKRCYSSSILITAMGCTALPALIAIAPTAYAQSVSRPSQELTVSIGHGKLVTVPSNLRDVFVANEAIADVQVKSARELYVFGKSGGETTVYASNAAGTVVWSSTVRVGSNIESVDHFLRLALPESQIGVATLGTNTYILTGSVASPDDAAEAERLIKAFTKGSADTHIINRLKTATPLQVNLNVRIAEVSRSLVKSLGVNLASNDPTGGFKFGINQGRPIGIPGIPGASVNVTGLEGSTTLSGMGRFLGLDLLGALDAGETVGLVTSLAQPNLTTVSGETADFLAGGEYPIPIMEDNNRVTIEYKRYGVSLSYTPTVLSNGRISMRVRPEVSELSSQGAISFGGYQVPSLTIRRTETTVELGSGQSFMIAGLLSNTSQNTIQKLPGAGDIPILGSLFRSTKFNKGETELVIVVTPYLVTPTNANNIQLPTDGFQTANDLQRILGNKESGYKNGPVPKPTMSDEVRVVPAQPAQPASSAPADSSAVPGFNLN